MSFPVSLAPIRARFRAASLVGALAALATLTACGGDGTSPRAVSLDTARLDASLAATQRALDAPAVASFLALSADVGAAAGVNASLAVGSVRAVLEARTQSPTAQRDAAIALSRAIDGRVATSAAPLLPSSVLGTTFVWSGQTQGYVPAPSRAGAPTNGVRFVLYAVNPITHAPVTTSEIGYADLTDDRPAAVNQAALRLRVVSGGTTYLDYALGGTINLTSATVGVDGFVTDGTTRLEFDVDAAARVQGGNALLDVGFAFDVPTHDFHSDATVSLTDANGGSADIEMRLVSVSDTVDVDAALTGAGTMNASFRVNGTLFATATGDVDAPTIRGAGGRELSAAEMAVLGKIVFLIDLQFDWLDALLSPLNRD